MLAIISTIVIILEYYDYFHRVASKSDACERAFIVDMPFTRCFSVDQRYMNFMIFHIRIGNNVVCSVSVGLISRGSAIRNVDIALACSPVSCSQAWLSDDQLVPPRLDVQKR